MRGPRRLSPDKDSRFGILSRGEVSEWLMVPLSKSGVRKHRGFESRPLRHNRPPVAMAADACVVASGPRSRTLGALAPVLGRRHRLDAHGGGLTSWAGRSAGERGARRVASRYPAPSGEVA